MGLGEEGSKDDQGTRSKGIFSSTFSVTLGGGGGGGYHAHNGQHYPVNGYPAPAPPPGAYSSYGGHNQAGYNYNHHSPPQHVPNNPASCQPGYNNSHSPPHHAPAPAPAYGAYPNSYGGHGGGGHGGYGGYHGQHQEQHVDYYHRREEIKMYQQQGYRKFPFGIVRRGISDAKV